MGDNNWTSGTLDHPTLIDKNYKDLNITSIDKSIRVMSTMKDFMKMCETRYKCNAWRSIIVTYPPDNGSDRKKPIGEKSSMTEAEIKKNRGKGCHYSLAIKHCKEGDHQLLCVDYDVKEGVENCDLYNQLKQSGTYHCETNKGYHFYIDVTGLPDYQNEVKVVIHDLDIDLIRQKRNMWEPKEREMDGIHLQEYDWYDIQKHFNHAKMNIAGQEQEQQQQVEQLLPNSDSAATLDEWDLPIDTTVESIGVDQIKGYLSRLSVKRYCYDDFVKVGIVLHNNFSGSDEGLSLWIEWTRADPSLATDHSHRTINYISQKYSGINGEPTSSWKSLRFWADKDSPINKYKTIYEEGGGDAITAELNKDLCYNMKTSEYILLLPNGDWEPKSKPQAKQHYEKFDFIIPVGDDIKVLNPWNLWWKNIKRREIHKIVFDPRDKSPLCYNLWKGFPMGSLANDKVASADVSLVVPLINHIHTKWCNKNQAHTDYVLNWFAMKLQKPWVKLCSVICLKSNEGSGKNIVLNKFKDGMGDYYVSINNINQVLGDFNGMIEGKMLIDLDEVSYGGNRAQNNKLKSLITEDEQIVNKKNKEMYKIDNYADYMITTNELYFLYVTTHSRRFFVLEMDNWLCGIVTPEKQAYIDEILAVPSEAFMKFLLERDISGFNPRSFLKTTLFQKQVELNWSSEIKYLYKVLESGALQTTKPRVVWNTDAWGFNGGFKRKNKADASKSDYWYKWDGLYTLYCNSDLGGYATRIPINQFYESLYDIFGEKIVEKKYRQGKVIKLPNLNEARKLFNKHQNFNYTFSEDLEELEEYGDWTMDHSDDD